MRADMFGETGAQISFLHQRVELAAADFNDGEFAGDEKSVQNNEDAQSPAVSRHTMPGGSQ